MTEPIHIISLGAGVQSSTMALMAAHGEITPMPTAAIFADTQAEPQSVYTWLDWLEKQLPFPVIRVGRPNVLRNALKIRVSSRTGREYMQLRIPAFTRNEQGETGMLWRQCTAFWKIEMVRKEVAQYAGQGVSMWKGISIDEAHRQKDSDKIWIEHRYPLIDVRMSRSDCYTWMEKHGYPEPPRSACYFCPFHSDAEWIRLKTEEPQDFQKAVKFEQRMQKQMAKVPDMDGVPYLHGTCLPLDQVEFRHERQNRLFGNECEGVCGV